MDSNYPNTMEGDKSAGQTMYTCRLCYREFYYYQDLALHERLHLEEMHRTGGLPQSTRPTYDNTNLIYNTSSVPSTTGLEGYEKLQSYHVEAQMRPHSDPRSVVPSSQTPDPRGMVQSTPAADLRSVVPSSQAPSPRGVVPSSSAQDNTEKEHIYRSEEPVETQTSQLDVRSMNMPLDTRSLPTDTRPLPIEPRTMHVESLGVQAAEGRSQPQDSRTPAAMEPRQIPYTSPPFLDSLGRNLYPAETGLKISPNTQVSYSTHVPMGMENYMSMESRKHIYPQPEGQVFTKPTAYYGLPRPHYSHLSASDKAPENYSASQYGINRLLGPAQTSYYAQPLAGQTQLDKVSSQSLNLCYSEPGPSQVGLKVDRKLPPSPKQTYYGQQPQSQPSNLSYSISLPRTSQISDSRESVNKVSERADMVEPYSGSHAALHSTYTELYKGPQPHTFTSVPSQVPPVQEYGAQKLSSEPVPTVNIDSIPTPPDCTCFICHAPFANMHEMSEHMKIHARESMLQGQSLNTVNSTPATTQPNLSREHGFSQSPVIAPAILQHHINVTPTSPVPYKSPVNRVTCQICGKTFQKTSSLAEHMKVHTEEQTFECKVCKKVFNKDSKRTRHEALHQRNIQLFYCEICEEPFKYKGNYLYHVQTQHSVSLQAGNAEPTDTVSRPEVVEKKSQPTPEKWVDCQVCDEEVEKSQLVDHLKTHPVHTCEKCDRVFIQKTEYVEHLMNDHWRELADSSDNKSGSENSDVEGADKNVEERELSDEKDSGLEEDNDKDLEETLMDDNTSEIAPSVNDKNITNTPAASLYQRKKEIVKKVEQKQLQSEAQPSAVNKEAVNKEDDTKEVNKKDSEDTESDENKTENKDVKLKFSCSKCDQAFAKKGDLTLHVEIHKKDPNRVYCEVCELSYHHKEKGYYIYHMKNHKDSELVSANIPSQLTCNVCYTSVKREKFVSHVKEKHSLYSCDICQWSYSSEYAMLIHIKKVHGYKKFKVVKKNDGEVSIEQKHVPVVYKKLKDIKAEQLSNQNSNNTIFTCSICSKTFKKKKLYDRHLKVHNVTVEGQQILCEICNVPFTSKGTYLYHIQRDHYNSNFKTSQEHVIELSHSDVQKSESSGEPLKVSEKAGVQQSSSDASENKKGTLEAPMSKLKKRTILNPVTGDFEEKMVEEDEKEVIVSENEEKNENEESVASLKSSDSEAVKDVVSEIMYCKLCNKCLKKKMLYDHMKNHTLFNCDICEYSFVKKSIFVSHRRLLHLEEYVTDEVESVLKLKKQKEAEQIRKISNDQEQGNDLKASEHSKRIRTETAKFITCLMCEVEFKQDKYVEHIKTHLKSKFTCQFCERQFSKKNNLVLHERSHARVSHGLKELPYPKCCPVCEKAVTSRVHYAEHIREHSKKRPLKCKKCAELFTCERSLENHVKVYHDSNLRLIWKLDGEGLKFDVRTGRAGDIISDYMSEIREINELMIQNGKTEIWLSPTPKKGREKVVNSSKSQGIKAAESEKSKDEEEDTEEEEKAKLDTSDEEYVPEDEEEDQELRRSARKKSSRRSYSDEDEDSSPSVKKRSRRSEYGSEESASEQEKYTPKGTSTRNISKGKAKKGKLVKGTDKKSLRGRGVKGKVSGVKKVIKKAKRSPSPEEEEVAVREKPFKCPVCQKGFTRNINMKRHVKDSHKRYIFKTDDVKTKDDVKSNDSVLTRSKLPEKSKTIKKRRSTDIGDPTSSSTPIKKAKLVVQLSPLDIEKVMNNSSSDTKESSFVCEYCNKEIGREWNYQQHLRKHKKEANTSINQRDKSSSSLPDKSIKSSPVVKKITEKKEKLTKISEKKEQNTKITERRGQPTKIVEKKDQVTEKKDQTTKIAEKKEQSKKKETSKEKDNESKDELKFVCDICNKVMFKYKYNFMRHVKNHKKDVQKKKDSVSKTVAVKKDLKKNGKESKPFSCKDCPESFKKKRDLYIHAKVHMDDFEEGESISDLPDSKENSSTNLSQSSSLNSSTDCSKLDNSASSGICESTEMNKQNFANTETDNQSNMQEVSYDILKTVSKSDHISDSKKTSKDVLDCAAGTKMDEKDEVSGEDKTNIGLSRNRRCKSDNPEVYENGQIKKLKTTVASLRKSNSEPHMSDGLVSNKGVTMNNNDVHNRVNNGETEERSKSKTPLSVTKMTAETALSKWKAKVQATLTSQLELNQAKTQEQLDNPGIAKVKEYLSFSGKIEKKRFECRLCGDGFDDEVKFRGHMDVHLNESPPYCSVCDIYFMAIYPKRRLAEHNKKKHSEMLK